MKISIAASVIGSVLVSMGHLFGQEDERPPQFPSIGERRMNLVAEKIESLGCVLDEKAILETKDGESIIFKHLRNPKGDISVTFNHLVMPTGNWILYGAKNSYVGERCEKAPETSPVRMEAVSAIVSGMGINATPRTLDDRSTYRMAYVDLSRIWGWDLKLAHSLTSESATHSFGYDVPEESITRPKTFNNHQLPIVNILHFDDNNALLAGALFWFEKQAEQPAADPAPKPEGNARTQPEKKPAPR
jgi:hypothetical protein